MSYQVVYTRTVIRQIEEQVQYLQNQKVSTTTIDAWFSRLFEAIDGLYEWPLRYPIAEAQSNARGFEIRKMNFDDYLIHYRVDATKQMVEVLSFFHGAQRQSD